MASTSTPESSMERIEQPEQRVRDGEQQQRRRRRDSDSEQRPPPRIPELPAYFGNDIQEAQDFISKAERRFRLDRGYYHPDDTSKIDYCVLVFEQKPYRKWSVFEEDAGGPGNTTWEQFKAHLFDSICDTENRQMSAIMAHHRACQQEGQTADDFAAELQVFERELGYTDDRRQAQTLFGKLRWELRKEISRRGNPPTTRKGMLNLARSIENAERLFSRPEEVKRERESSERAARTCRHCGGDHANSQCPQAVCFKCQGTGHYASACQS
jgi:hypothetical protein